MEQEKGREIAKHIGAGIMNNILLPTYNVQNIIPCMFSS